MKFNKEQINAVLFKLNDGKVAIIQRNNGEWDWNSIVTYYDDNYNDLSAVDPFEFVFCYTEGDKIHTENCKTIIENTSFLKLYDAGLFEKWIDLDYRMQYEGLAEKMENGEDGWIATRFEKNQRGEWNKI
jgi:hypothetical protein